MQTKSFMTNLEGVPKAAVRLNISTYGAGPAIKGFTPPPIASIFLFLSSGSWLKRLSHDPQRCQRSHELISSRAQLLQLDRVAILGF